MTIADIKSGQKWYRCFLWRLETWYKLTEEKFFRMLGRQKESCAICGDRFTSTKNMHIDHCHKNGHVRGLLCYRCNTGLGSFRDSTKNLRAAIRYLDRDKLLTLRRAQLSAA